MNRASSVSLRTTALATLLGVAAALPVAAQQDPRVRTAADVAQSIEQAKARADFVILGRILRQEWGPVPEAARRLAQDSLVAVATRGDRTDERSYDAARAALTRIAQRPDPSAETAVVMLMRHHGSEGEQLLRRLHADGVVRHPETGRRTPP